MAVLKIRDLTINGITIDDPVSFSFDADNGITYSGFNATNYGFPSCAIKSEQTRTGTIEAYDVDTMASYGFCSECVPVSVRLEGVCGSPDCLIEGCAVVSDFTINASVNGERKTAGLNLTFISPDGIIEPVTFTCAP